MKKILLTIVFLALMFVFTACDEEGNLWMPDDIRNDHVVETTVPVPTAAPTREPRDKAEFVYDNEHRPDSPVIDTGSCIVAAGETLVVRINAASSGEKIYYTLDGTRPNSSSNIYKGPLTVLKANDKTVSLTAVAVDIFGHVSDTAGAFYQHYVAFRDPEVERVITEFLEIDPGKVKYEMLNGIESIIINGNDVQINIDKHWENALVFDSEDKSFVNKEMFSNQKGNIRYLDDFDLMSDLKHLVVNNCQVKEIPDFKRINLETLSLMDNYIEDIDSLEYPVGMNTLFLDNNRISDVTKVFGSINNLNYVSLSGNPLRDYDFSECVSLMYIWLDDTGLAEIPDLSNSNMLRYIDLSQNSIRDVSDLTSFYELELLDLSYNEITDISGFDEPITIQVTSYYTDYTGNGLETIKYYGGCNVMNLSGNCISDLKPLKNIVNLWKLIIKENGVPIEPSMIEGLGNIKIITD